MSAGMQRLIWTDLEERELSGKAKLSIFQLVDIPTFTCGRKLWVLSERMRSRYEQAGTVPSEGWRVKQLLLHIERSQLLWQGHSVRMLPGQLPLVLFQANPTGREPWNRPRTHWRDYRSHLVWKRFVIPQQKLESTFGGGILGLKNLDVMNTKHSELLKQRSRTDVWL